MVVDLELALCRSDPELFFPHDKDRESRREAINACKRCVVLDPCREATRDLEQRLGRQQGVWAGLTEAERRLAWSCNGAAGD
jgi:Transcription factor WhiB